MTSRPGDVPFILDGRTHTLRFTLGALARIEARLGLEDLSGLGARLARLTAAELCDVLAALIVPEPGDDPHKLALSADPALAARALAECLSAQIK